MAQGWDKSTRVNIDQLLWLLVRVYFDILVLELFQFQRDPDSLDEGAGEETLTRVRHGIDAIMAGYETYHTVR